MTAELHEQLQRLRRDCARLEDMLAVNAEFAALQALDSGSLEGAAAADPAAAAALTAALSSNPLFVARRSLLDAIAVLEHLVSRAEAADESMGQPVGIASEGGGETDPSGADRAMAAEQAPESSMTARVIPASAAVLPADLFAPRGRRGGAALEVEPEGAVLREAQSPGLATIHDDLPGGEADEPPSGPMIVDDMTAIRCIDRSLAAALVARGIRTWDQIARFNAVDVKALSAALALGRRISRENWIEQAALLVHKRQAPGPSPISTGGPSEVATAAEAVGGSQAPDDAVSLEPQAAGGSDALTTGQNAAQPPPSAEAPLAMLVRSAVLGIVARARPAPTTDDSASETQPAGAAFSSTDEGEGFWQGGLRTGDEQPAPDVAPAEVPEETLLAWVAPAEPPDTAGQPTLVAVPAAHLETEDQAPSITGAADATNAHFATDAGLFEADPAPAARAEERADESSDNADPSLLPPPDDLQQIRGIGPELAAALNEVGVFHWSEIAAWRHDDVRVAQELLGPSARINVDCWIEQAALLSRGGQTAYAASRSAGWTGAVVAMPDGAPQRDASFSAWLAHHTAGLSTLMDDPAHSLGGGNALPEHDATSDTDGEPASSKEEVIEPAPPPLPGVTMRESGVLHPVSELIDHEPDNRASEVGSFAEAVAEPDAASDAVPPSVSTGEVPVEDAAGPSSLVPRARPSLADLITEIGRAEASDLPLSAIEVAPFESPELEAEAGEADPLPPSSAMIAAQAPEPLQGGSAVEHGMTQEVAGPAERDWEAEADVVILSGPPQGPDQERPSFGGDPSGSSSAFNSDDYAAYRNRVEEASVEIVPASTSTSASRDDGESGAHARGAESGEVEAPDPSNPVRRFLNALKGT